jgi:hypothetical protein
LDSALVYQLLPSSLPCPSGSFFADDPRSKVHLRHTL